MLKVGRLYLWVLCFSFFAVDAGAQGLPRAVPEDVGMSSTRLARVDQLMEKYVDASQIAGAISLVARKGKVVHFNAYGARNIATGEPMTTDTIVRIYSILSGGGGLVSTASDYIRFAQMLLNGGELDGVRLLGRKTVAYMTVNHIDGVHAPGYGFGLGFSVRLEDKAPGVIGTPGAYGWNGAANTHYFADPEEEVIGIFLTQFMPYGRYPLLPYFRVALYQALVD